MRIRTITAAIIVVALGLGVAAALAASEAPRWDADEGMSEPKAIYKVNPVYPEAAREERVMGTVVLDATINTDGSIGDVKVVEDPDPRLSQAAVDAVVQWRFEPARDSDNEKIAVRYSLTIKFALK